MRLCFFSLIFAKVKAKRISGRIKIKRNANGTEVLGRKSSWSAEAYF